MSVTAPVQTKKASLSVVAMYNYDHMGARAIHSAAKAAGYPTDLIFFKNMNFSEQVTDCTDKEIDCAIGVLADRKPDIVGISLCYSTFFDATVRLSKAIHERLGIPVLWGGVHPTLVPRGSIEHCDYMCVGEGEDLTNEILERLTERKPIETLPGLWIRNGGDPNIGATRDWIDDLDRLPFPDYDDADKFVIEDDCVTEGDPMNGKQFNYAINASRGCPFPCTFCSEPSLKGLGETRQGYTRRRGVQNVIDELSFARDRCPEMKRVTFYDNVFVLNKEWAEEFATKYKENIGLPFNCLFHPKVVKPEIVKILCEGGLDFIDIGIQSGSERIRKGLFRRPETNAEITKAMHVMHDNGMAPFTDLIVDNPYNTTEDHQETLDLLLSFPRPFQLYIYSMIWFPQTGFTNQALSDGKIKPEDVEDVRKKVFEQFQSDFAWRGRTPEEVFWICLFSMSAKVFVPKGLLRWLSKSSYLMKQPRPLIWMTKLCNWMRLVALAIKRIRTGEFSFAAVRKYLKYALTVNR